jgi:hypothetical protein
MAFLKSRNRNLDERFSTIAADYMRVGEQLKIRWDIAFFQMMLETGNLTFKGDVSSKQNNFAGLGATGRHVPGESFPDVATGVKAHLQHLLLYAGEKLDNPVAERTRKVQEWGVLVSWQKTLKGPINYSELAKQWAPTSRHYASDISGIAEAFYASPCQGADPNPELMALAKPGSTPAKPEAPVKVASATEAAPAETAEEATPKLSGADLARRAVEEARRSGSFVRSSLGAESLIPAGNTPAVTVGEPVQTNEAPTSVKIINASLPESEAAASVESEPSPRASAEVVPVAPKKSLGKKIQTAALGAGTKSALSGGISSKSLLTPPAGPRPTCKVWTASYGGSHSVIIKARVDQQDNYTVLDVNEGSEKREADAYISAYAKGGKSVGEFANPSQALDKAFELCPDG